MSAPFGKLHSTVRARYEPVSRAITFRLLPPSWNDTPDWLPTTADCEWGSVTRRLAAIQIFLICSCLFVFLLFVAKFSPFVVVIYIFLYRFKITRFRAICSPVLDIILVLLLFHIRLIFECVLWREKLDFIWSRLLIDSTWWSMKKFSNIVALWMNKSNGLI